MKPAYARPAWVEIDLSAVGHNAAELLRIVDGASLCAVVKADGYGHGAPEVAAAALAGGASWLAVALVEEGVALREAGIQAPCLVLSEPAPEAIEEGVRRNLSLTVYTRAGVRATAAAAAGAAGAEAVRSPVSAAGRSPGSAAGRASVQVKLDSGMHRVGVDPGELAAIVAAVCAEPSLSLDGLYTHFAVADEPEDPFTAEQVSRLEAGIGELEAAGLPVPALIHAANSAAAIAHPASRFELVRCGIALYGHAPSVAMESYVETKALRPVLSWKARVSQVRTLAAGERPSYGRLRPLPETSVVATVPLGYHDGIPRRYLGAGGEVLIGGRRCPLAGAVTMDQIVVDCGPPGLAPPVAPGDEVVLIGRQAEAEITAGEWAARLGVITYEVLCGIGPRVPRKMVGGGGR